MRTDIVFTLTGPDRVGVVEVVTSILLDLGANVETSRMARLGGEFAIIMQVSLPAERTAALEESFSGLVSQGYKITVTETAKAEPSAQCRYFRVQVEGADHEGIVNQVAQVLSRRGINIESAETYTSSAPVSGAPLFHMDAIVSVPAMTDENEWMAAVTEAGERSGVDVTVTAAD